jgi:hypothetical protein
MTRRWLAALAIGAALAALLSYPTIVEPGSMTRFDSGDGRFSTWNVAWVAHALLDDPRHLFDANIFYPHPGALAYSEANLVAGAMAVPVYALTRNPVAAHNVVIYSVLVIAFVAMWALVFRLTGAFGPALVAATAFAFAPFVAARTAHMQLLMVFVFPVAMIALHRFVDAPGVRRGAILGLSLALAALSCGYYGIYAGLAVGLGSLWFAFRHPSPRAYWSGLLVAVVVPIAIVGPVLRPYLVLRAEAGAREQINVEELRSYSADARAYLTSPSHAHRWITNAVGTGREVLFPGAIVTVLAATALVRRRVRRPEAVPVTSTGKRRLTPLGFYLLLGLLAAWASFGPDAGFYTLLSHSLPFMSFLRAPARIGIVVVFALAVLAGHGLARMTASRGRALASAVLVVLVAAEVSAAPWPLRAVPPVPDAYRMLAQLPRGTVVDFHFPYRREALFAHTRAMFWSMWHWQPLVNGYSDFIPADFAEIRVPINGFPDAESFRIMQARNVRYVVINLADYEPAHRAILMARFAPYQEHIRPVIESGDVLLYEIVSYPDR